MTPVPTHATALLSRGSQVRVLPGALLASREAAPGSPSGSVATHYGRREWFRVLPARTRSLREPVRHPPSRDASPLAPLVASGSATRGGRGSAFDSAPKTSG